MSATTPVFPRPGNADIVLAECSGQAWLIRGEPYIDDLLANTLREDVSIEVVICDSKVAVDALWAAEGGEEASWMWLIHPAILRRAKGQQGEMAVVFGAWSAALDEQASGVLMRVARAIAAAPGCCLVLVRHLVEDEPGIAMQLADLRCRLIESHLETLLAAQWQLPATFLRETAPAVSPEQQDRIALRIV